jgi:hypothetical protein
MTIVIQSGKIGVCDPQVRTGDPQSMNGTAVGTAKRPRNRPTQRDEADQKTAVGMYKATENGCYGNGSTQLLKPL